MNKRKVTEQILNVISATEDAVQINREPYFEQNSELLKHNMAVVGKAFSGSWLGYHANVYYQDFATPPPRHSFSTEWGLMSPHGRRGPGGWSETTYETVKAAVMDGVDPDYEGRLSHISGAATTAFEDTHASLTTLLAVLTESNSTSLLEGLQSEVRDIKGFVGQDEILNYMCPSGSIMSRDSKAMSQGVRTPPHAALEAWHISQFSPFDALNKIVLVANKLLKYMQMHDLVEHASSGSGSKVFIGHGRSPEWRELKDFITDRLHLEWDEFNREPTAGIATTERLQMMLDQARFAFLVMTAEDQRADGTMHARENVIHEVGLFQGKLAFRRAIVLLEEGCSEFSNIAGLTQIRFPSGNLGGCFEEVRRVLEREGLLA